MQENTIRRSKLEENASIYQPNIRAEDGLPQKGGWNALYEEVLIPCGFVFALLLILVIAILVRS
ncbi:MAG TPA: hypothetical protein VGM27_02570 [Acidobacteriaceae bacterium]|jgi:hypothetical protein